MKTMGWLKRPKPKPALKMIALLLIQTFAMSVYTGRQAYAQINTPMIQSSMQQGGLTPNDAPCLPFQVGFGTGTAEVLLVSSRTTDTTGFVIGNSTGVSPGYINWILVSTGAVQAFVVIRDTYAVGSTDDSRRMFGPISFSSGSTNNGWLYQFQPPAIFRYGLTAQLQGTTGREAATICARTYNLAKP